MKRNLDGVFFKIQNDDGKYENICFSDMTEKQQDWIMQGRDAEYLKLLCKILAKAIRDIGDQFDIIME